MADKRTGIVNKDIPDFLSWKDFIDKYKEHTDFLEKKATYVDAEGNRVDFLSYDQKSGEVFVWKRDSERISLSLKEFDQMLKGNEANNKVDLTEEHGSAARAGFKNKSKGLNFPIEEEKDPARAGTLHTLYKLGQSEEMDLADLVPEGKIKVLRNTRGKLERMDIDYDPDKATPEEKEEMSRLMNEKFNEVTRKLWNLLVTHGYAEEQEDGTYRMTKNVSDLDGESCLTLCRLAGLENANVKYVPQGQGGEEDGLVMDTSGNDGILAKKGGKTVIVDHHGEESGKDTSATKHVYNFLIENGLLEKRDYLDDYVEFVTQEDNKEYSALKIDPKERFENSWRTLRGLRNFITPEDIIKLFENSRASGKPLDPDESLDDHFFKSYRFKAKTDDKYDLLNDGKTLEELAQIRKNRIEKSLEAVKRMEQQGFVFDTGEENYGKILIDVGKMEGGRRKKEISLGHEAAMFLGYDNLLNWDPRGNGMALYTKKSLGDIRFTQGINIRGNYWLVPKTTETLQVTLEEIFSKLRKKRTKVPQNLVEALGKRGLARILVEAPKGVDVMADSDKAEPAEREIEVSPERWELMQILIRNYIKGGKEWLALLKGGKLFSAPKTLEEEKEEIEKFIRQGVLDYNKEFSPKKPVDSREIDFIAQKAMESIFTK